MKKQMKRRLISVLACVVVFITTYAMILPAITMTKDSQVLTCAAEIHRHDASCYEDVIEDGNVVGKRLICGKAGYVVHEHNADCYTEIDGQKVLVCTLPEIKEHKHGAECYEEQKILSCGLEESADHQHTDDCYTEEKVLICDQLELHEHDADCYEEGHEGDAAYLTCGKLELVEHTHGAACLEKAEQTDEQKIAAAKEAAQERLAFAESLESMSEYEAVPDGIAKNEEETSEEVEAQIEEISKDDIEEIEESAGEDSVKVRTKDGHADEEELGSPLTFEDDTIKVIATPVGEEFPAGAELVVTRITSDMGVYDAYFAALNRGFDDNPYNGENSLLFDVSVLVDGREFEPSTGKIEIKIDFKEKQLSEMLGSDLDENAPIRVFHLPVAGEDNTSLESVNESDISLEYISEAVLESDVTDSVSFSLDSLSVITVTTANTSVTITGALSGTDMKTIGYNLYAYLVPESGKIYGAKMEFADGTATATVPNVPAGSYTLVLAYPKIKYEDDGQLKDNREFPTPSAEQNQVLDSNFATWVSETGGYVFGYSAVMPADKTITASDNTIGFELKVSNPAEPIDVYSIMDRALNYGITANSVIHTNNCYTNFAAKTVTTANQNGNQGATYGNRASGESVPNLIVDAILQNNQPMRTNDKNGIYYVPSDEVDNIRDAAQHAVVRNKNEIEDRIEIMISNTLKQTEKLVESSSLKLEKGTTAVDLSAYGDDATIILDATDVSGETNGFMIVKRPGQTVVFNIRGENVSVPANTKVKLVNSEGQQVDINGTPSTKVYIAGKDMENADAVEGNVWNRLIWNFPDSHSVSSSNNIGGIFLVPNGDFTVGTKGGGWIVARGNVNVDSNEWYAFPGTDTPFEEKTIRKVFAGLSQEEIESIKDSYKLELYTHTNASTSSTTDNQRIGTFVISEPVKTADKEAIKSGLSPAVDAIGYSNTGTDAEGNIFYEWKTPELSIGSEHKVTENNSDTVSTSDKKLKLIEFEGGYSGWSDAAQNYVWEMRHSTYGTETDFNATDSQAIFNVRSYRVDRSEYDTVTVTNYYSEDPHNLTLKKVVKGQSDDENREYTFEILLKKRDGSAWTDSVTYKLKSGSAEEEKTVTPADSKLAIKLKAGESAELLNLPFGTQYVIAETNIPDDCTVSFSGDTNGTEETPGRLYLNRSVTATNTYRAVERKDLQIEKNWVSHEQSVDWPEDYTVEYTVNQIAKLANGTVVATTPYYVVNSETHESDILSESHEKTTLEKVPLNGVYTPETSDSSKGLKAGTEYQVFYSYTVTETAVKKDGTEKTFRVQTVEAELDAAEGVYKAALENKLNQIKIRKVWNGMTPGASESATIRLYRFERTTYFPYTVTVTGDTEALEGDGFVNVTIYDQDGNPAGSGSLSKDEGWTKEFTLEAGKTYHAEFTGDGTVLNTTVTPATAGDITGEGTTEIAATVKPTKMLVNIEPNWWYYGNYQGLGYTPTDGYIDVEIYANSGNGAKVYEGRMLPSSWTLTGIELDKQSSGQYKVVFKGDGTKILEVGDQYINCNNQDSDTVKFNAKYNKESGGVEGGTSSFGGVNVPSDKISNQWGSITYTKPLQIGTEYDYWIQVHDIGVFANFSVEVVGGSYRVDTYNDYSTGGQLHLYITPTNSSVSVNLAFPDGARSRRALQAKAPASFTWTNDTSGLPEGADPSANELVEEVQFKGNNWSKIWNDLPQYAPNGKEYVYYAYETAYTGAANASSMTTTYSTEADGTLVVTNLPTYEGTGNLTVTKEVYYNDELNTDANGHTFTVGVFTDVAGTTRVSGVADQSITVNAGRGEAIFAGLQPGTYYVYEVVDGEAITGTEATINGIKYTVAYTDNAVTVSSGSTATAKVINTQEPYKLNLVKVDEQDNSKKLDGAEFTLYRLTYDEDTGRASRVDNSEITVTTQNSGTAMFTNLVIGYYELKETKSPNGYIRTKDESYYLNVTGAGVQLVIKEDGKNPAEWAKASISGMASFTADSGSFTITVKNEPGYVLPSTGGSGTKLFTILGTMLVLSAGILLISRRRKA